MRSRLGWEQRDPREVSLITSGGTWTILPLKRWFGRVTPVDGDLRPIRNDALPQLDGLKATIGPNSDKARTTEPAHLKGLTKLSELSLSNNQVSDAGLAHLKGLTKLKFLYLSGTQVTDAGLMHLKGLTRLSSLDLTGTHVTQSGVQELQKVLPYAQILP